MDYGVLKAISVQSYIFIYIYIIVCWFDSYKYMMFVERFTIPLTRIISLKEVRNTSGQITVGLFCDSPFLFHQPKHFFLFGSCFYEVVSIEFQPSIIQRLRQSFQMVFSNCWCVQVKVM